MKEKNSNSSAAAEKKRHSDRREESINLEWLELRKFWDKKISRFARNDTGLSGYKKYYSTIETTLLMKIFGENFWIVFRFGGLEKNFS